MTDLPTTYSRSLQTMVFCRADPKQYAPTNQRERTSGCKTNQIANGPRKGWDYWSISRRGQRRQLQLPVRPAGPVRGPAGVRRLAHGRPRQRRRLATAPGPIGKAAKTPTALGAITRTYPGTGSMTCAGIASLVIANDMVSSPTPSVKDGQIQCCGQGRRGEQTRSSGESIGWGETSASQATPGASAARQSGGSTTSTAWSASGG